MWRAQTACESVVLRWVSVHLVYDDVLSTSSLLSRCCCRPCSAPGSAIGEVDVFVPVSTERVYNRVGFACEVSKWKWKEVPSL